MIAATVALAYAWFLSQTALIVTGLQFVAPVAIVIGVHLLWCAGQGRLQPGFANRLYGKAAGTALFMAMILLFGAVFAPQPAFANGSEAGQLILMVLFCAGVIAAVMFVVGAAVYVVFKVIGWTIDGIRLVFFKDPNDGDDPPQSRLFDIGSLLVCGTVLFVGSLEGLPKSYAFATQGSATAGQTIDAKSDAVWQAMQTATSPDFALPAALDLFPQPVAVSVDEGVALGANRVVDFAGREGAGALHLQVMQATDTAVVFEVLSDTTPYAQWIGYRALRYRVVPQGDVTQLSVSLDFERKLAPAWFFDPLMEKASHLAMDVLARDIKTRSERPL